MNIAYDNLSHIGFIKYTKDYVRNDEGISYNLNDFEKFFFGKELKDEIGRLDLCKENIIYYNEDGVPFIYQNKIGDYILYVQKILDFEKGNYICINYYKFIGYSNNKGKQFRIMKAINNIKNCLDIIIKTKNLSDNYRKVINEIIIHYIGEDYFKGYISDSLQFDDNSIINIKFDTLNKPFYINLVDKFTNSNEFFINIDEEYDHLTYCTYVSKIIDTILMNDKDTYMFEKIYKINGNKSFTQLFLDSWKEMNNFIINTELLSILIQFKNNKSKKNYEEKFKQKYKKYYEEKDGILFVNFEGINNYLLFLDTKYLLNESSKDPIIDMFNKSMIELMKSYEELYNHSIS